MDVTDPAQVKAAVQSAITAFGRLDVLVNNAGYAQPGAPEALADLSLWQREIICPAGSGLSNRAMPPLSISSMTDPANASWRSWTP